MERLDKHIRLKVISNSLHISQIITGFISLKDFFEKNGYTLVLDDQRASRLSFPHKHLIEANIDGKRIAFDMLDGYQETGPSLLKYLSSVDYYFKRSYNSVENEILTGAGENKDLISKIYPLGLNYHVTIKGNPQDKYNFKQSVFNFMRVLAGGKSSSYFTEDKIHAIKLPNVQKLKILFLARLWEGNVELNDMRINIIRTLKQKYPNNFIGGLQDSPLVKKMCPDLRVSRVYAFRNKYLKRMHNADICIASAGLHKSIGWKMGEYVASGKAIVSEKLYYEVPGDFKEGVNYLEYNTVDECIAAVDRLMTDSDLLNWISQNNQTYYNEYLKPAKLVLNALNTASLFMAEDL